MSGSDRITIGKARPDEGHSDYWVVRKNGKLYDKNSFHLKKEFAQRQADAIREVRKILKKDSIKKTKSKRSKR